MRIRPIGDRGARAELGSTASCGATVTLQLDVGIVRSSRSRMRAEACQPRRMTSSPGGPQRYRSSRHIRGASVNTAGSFPRDSHARLGRAARGSATSRLRAGMNVRICRRAGHALRGHPAELSANGLTSVERRLPAADCHCSTPGDQFVLAAGRGIVCTWLSKEADDTAPRSCTAPLSARRRRS